MKYKNILPLFLLLVILNPMSALAYETGRVGVLLSHPVVEGILAAVIILSIIAEVKSAGFSGGILIASVAGLILIGNRWSSDDSQTLSFLLYFGGLALLILDILFLISGMGVVVGFVLVLAGLFYSFGGDVMALYILAGAVILAGILGYFLIGKLSESILWKKISLSTELTGKKGFKSHKVDLSDYVGKIGTAITVLRPVGKISVDGKLMEAMSESDFIKERQKVIVKKVESNYVVVSLYEEKK